MKQVSITHLKKDFDSIMQDIEANNACYEITKYGKPVAVLLPMSYYETIEKSLSEWKR